MKEEIEKLIEKYEELIGYIRKNMSSISIFNPELNIKKADLASKLEFLSDLRELLNKQ